MAIATLLPAAPRVRPTPGSAPKANLRVFYAPFPMSRHRPQGEARRYRTEPIDREDVMHPLFEELFINTDDAEFQAERERRARRTRRNRSRIMTVRSRTGAPMPRGSSG